MKIVLHNDQEHVVVAESKDFQLIQEKFCYDMFMAETPLTVSNVSYRNAELALFYKDYFVAKSGCEEHDPNVYCLARDQTVKMIQDMASKGM